MSYSLILKKIFKSYFFTLLLILLAFFLRFYKFDSVGFWGDEYLSFWLSEPYQTFNEIFLKTRSSPDLVPPFYYYILNIYNHLFDYSAYSLRFFHIIIGSSCLALVFFISNYLLSRSANNLVIYLLSANVFLIWCSTEARVVSVALFFQLSLIYVFFRIIKNLDKKFSLLNIILLIIFNIFALTIHPLSIAIISAQILFFLLLIIKNNKKSIKNNFIYIFLIISSCLIYILINKDYFFSSLEGSRLGHNQLSLEFFIGYNFKHYFTSYILGFINLLLILLSFLKLRKKIFENLYILYLVIIFVLTYTFIILGTTFFTGLNGQKYWSYLVPIIIIINIYYLTELQKNKFSKILILILIFYAPINYFNNINSPQVRKPDTPGLINIINKSNINTVVSDNYGMFEHYLKFGYKNFNKSIVSKEDIININNDFWYLCLDLSWDQTKGSYWDEMYDCFPKNIKIDNYNRLESLRLNGLVITKYKFNG